MMFHIGNLPWYLKETNFEIGVHNELVINFWRGLGEKSHFYDGMSYVQIECIKLPDSIYFKGIPIKNTDHYIYILIGGKYNNQSKKA